MTLRPDVLAELRALIEALCEETISAEQMTHLEEMVLADPAAEEFYITYLHMQGRTTTRVLGRHAAIRGWRPGPALGSRGGRPRRARWPRSSGAVRAPGSLARPAIRDGRGRADRDARPGGLMDRQANRGAAGHCTGSAGRRPPLSQGGLRERPGHGRPTGPGRMGAGERTASRRRRSSARGTIPVPLRPRHAVDAHGCRAGRGRAGRPGIRLPREGLLLSWEAAGPGPRGGRGLRRLGLRLRRRRSRDRVRDERRARWQDAG